MNARTTSRYRRRARFLAATAALTFTAAGCGDSMDADGDDARVDVADTWTASAEPGEPTPASVGLLVVVEAGGGARAYQEAFASDAIGVVDAMRAYDFAFAVTTTAPSAPLSVDRPGPVRDANCLAPTEEVHETCQDGAGPDGYGTDLDALYCALHAGDCESGNHGLRRAAEALDAHDELTSRDALVIAVLSDDDDCSTTTGEPVASFEQCYGADARDALAPVDAYVDAIAALRPDGLDSVWVVNFIGPDDGAPFPSAAEVRANGVPATCTRSFDEPAEARDGERYRAFCERFGPRCLEASVCAGDYDLLPDTLQTLELDLAFAPYICLDAVAAGQCEVDDDCPGACVFSAANPDTGICDSASFKVSIGAADAPELVTVDATTGGSLRVVAEDARCGGAPAIVADDARVKDVERFDVSWTAVR